MSKTDPGKDVIAQIVGHKSLKITGGLRVEIDLFDVHPEDVCYVTLLSIDKATVKLNIKPYEEDKKGKTKEPPPEYK